MPWLVSHSQILGHLGTQGSSCSPSPYRSLLATLRRSTRQTRYWVSLARPETCALQAGEKAKKRKQLLLENKVKEELERAEVVDATARWAGTLTLPPLAQGDPQRAGAVLERRLPRPRCPGHQVPHCTHYKNRSADSSLLLDFSCLADFTRMAQRRPTIQND